jgi:hypothetical protein
MQTKPWKPYLWGAAVLMAVCLFGSVSLAAGPTAQECVGQDQFDFTLPSTHDRLSDYGKDYYGRYHLVLTFFPAAFTPV